MLQTFDLQILLAYNEECEGFTLKESVEYLTERGKDFCQNTRMVTEQRIQKILFKNRYGSESIPARMSLLMCGGFPNFDNLTTSEKEEIKMFNVRWDEMFS